MFSAKMFEKRLKPPVITGVFLCLKRRLYRPVNVKKGQQNGMMHALCESSINKYLSKKLHNQ